MVKNATKRYSLETLKAQRDRGEMLTRPDAPEYEIDEEFWKNARIVMPQAAKTSIHLRVDGDVLEWFKSQGRGHLTRMNAVLRSYMEASRKRG